MPYLDLSAHFRPYYEIHDFSDPDVQPETVLFIHGFTESTPVWRSWIPGLSRNYRLLTFDIRGFGKTGAVDADFEYSTELLVDDIVRILGALVGEAVHVVSGKSGAITATRFAATRPDLVKSLVLTCPPLTAPGSTDWLPVMESRGMRAWARDTMPARLGASTSAKTMDWWVDVMGETAISTAKAYLRWVVDTRPDEDLAKAQCPVLVIMTKPTATTNVTAGLVTPERIQEVLPSAEIELLPLDCYHAAAIAPDACSALAKAFFQRHAKPGA